MSSKQLGTVNIDYVNAKIEAGFGLTLKELAVKTGYSYEIVRRWKARGLPLLDNRVTYEDFLTWKNWSTGLAADPQQPSKQRATNARTNQNSQIDDISDSFIKRLRRTNRYL